VPDKNASSHMVGGLEDLLLGGGEVRLLVRRPQNGISVASVAIENEERAVSASRTLSALFSSEPCRFRSVLIEPLRCSLRKKGAGALER